jgi:hypothetical protein
MDSNHGIPWDNVKKATLLALCKDLGIPENFSDTAAIIACLRSIEKRGRKSMFCSKAIVSTNFMI